LSGLAPVDPRLARSPSRGPVRLSSPDRIIAGLGFPPTPLPLSHAVGHTWAIRQRYVARPIFSGFSLVNCSCLPQKTSCGPHYNGGVLSPPFLTSPLSRPSVTFFTLPVRCTVSLLALPRGIPPRAILSTSSRGPPLSPVSAPHPSGTADGSPSASASHVCPPASVRLFCIVPKTLLTPLFCC